MRNMAARAKTNRRQFLAGKSATVALGDVVDAWAGAAPSVFGRRSSLPRPRDICWNSRDERWLASSQSSSMRANLHTRATRHLRHWISSINSNRNCRFTGTRAKSA